MQRVCPARTTNWDSHRPADQPSRHQPIERASGVSEVEVDGAVLRCLVSGSFQPFLEALRGYEVVSLKSMFTKGEGERADS